MNFSGIPKLTFYFMLAYYKLTAPFECNNLRLKVLFNEFAFLFTSLGLRRLRADDKSEILLKTKLGNYMIRNIDIDFSIASPAYERLDINELIKRISNSLALGHNVLFLDIGANFGKFTVAIGKYFRSYKERLFILSFEPEQHSYKLLLTNMRLNKLLNVKAFNIALSDKEGIQKFYYLESMNQIVSFPTPQKIIIKTSKLDNYRKYMTKSRNVDIYIKLDVEEHEINVLRGSKKTVGMYNYVTLLVEDQAVSTHDKLMKYLTNHGTLLTKKAAYNSFWKLSS